MRLKLALGLLLASTAVSAAQPQLKFTDDSASSGVEHTYDGEWEQMVGGGVATFDCNGDHLPDMVIAGGIMPAKFYRNVSERGGQLRFAEEKSGTELEMVSGAYPLDIDSDGIMDLLLLRVGENVVMRGKGNCQFERANESWGFDGGDGWSTAYSAIWEKGATWPTIAIGNYINRKEETSPWGSCTDNWLHRPSTDNHFAAPLPLKPSFCPLSMLFTDWNNSGSPSLRVSNDREYYEGGQEQMWKVFPGAEPKPYMDTEGWKPLKIWGMGIATHDLTGDGFPEYYLTSMADQKLQTLTKAGADAKPDYADVAFKKGVTAHRPYAGEDLKPSTGWHAQFEDVNNDGLMDLYVAKGNVWDMPDFAKRDPNNMFVQKADGNFEEQGATSGAGSFENSRGAMVVDFNLDGLLDIVVVNKWVNVQLFRNTSTDIGNSIQLKLHQTGPNPDAIGAKLEIKRGAKTEMREVFSGGGHVSGMSGFWHWGLGPDKYARIRVVWPDGAKSVWYNVKANQFYAVDRDKGVAQLF